MKAQREHRVPLSSFALSLLTRMQQAQENNYVFPGAKMRKPLSNMAMLKVLERMQATGLTVHGFRSSFRDWAAEQTHHSNEVIEMALAHTVRSKVEAAYRRGDLLAKRAILMEDWALFLCSEQAQTQNVFKLQVREPEKIFA
jgi:integrase